MKEYIDEYKEFIRNYKAGVTTGEDVGLLIAQMAQRFVEANLLYSTALIAYNKIAAMIEGTTDAGTGKTISSAKASVMTDATPESDALIQAKIDVGNLEQILNAAKSLQRGIMAEFSHTNNM